MEQTQKDNIIKKLIDTHTTVSTMESCTSGMIDLRSQIQKEHLQSFREDM
ncbi:MAG: hypothetical protein ACLVB1_15130 [Blautia obeum]